MIRVIMLLCVCIIIVCMFGNREGMENIISDPTVPTVPSTWFMASNTHGPQCCNTIFSSSNGGCVCVTEEQDMFLKTRGGNRTSPD